MYRGRNFKCYDELKNELLNQVESGFFISLGTIVEEIRYLKDSYSNAKKLKKFMLTKGANIVITEKMISCVESRKINFKDEINQINKLVIEKNFEALKKICRNSLCTRNTDTH